MTEDNSHNFSGHALVAVAILSTGFLFRRSILLGLRRCIQYTKQGDGKYFLERNFGPVDQEVMSNDLPTEGSLPDGLDGCYIRTGPNPAHKPRGGYHWFDGEAMVHAVQFQDGKAKAYANHWVRSPLFLKEKDAGGHIFMRLGDMTGVTGVVMIMLNYLMSPQIPALEGGSVGNTAVHFHARRLLAVAEQAMPFVLRVCCSGLIESAGMHSFSGKLDRPFSAHPKIDPVSGEMVTFGYTVESKPYVTCSLIDASGDLMSTVPVDVLGPIMMHDFAITPNYAIFMDHNLIFNPEAMVKTGGLPFVFDGSRKGRIGFLDRKEPTKPVQWFEVDPFACFHTANAWEEGPLVHLVLCSYNSLNLNAAMDPSKESPENVSKLIRCTMNTETGHSSWVELGGGVDFPVVCPSKVGQPSKYTWAATLLGCTMFDGIMKAEITCDEAQTPAKINLPKNHYAGEFAFVPRPVQASEDDGWLVGYVTDESDVKNMVSYCFIYDALTMSDTPLAKVTLPQRVPYGFHGTFVTREQLKSQLT